MYNYKLTFFYTKNGAMICLHFTMVQHHSTNSDVVCLHFSCGRAVVMRAVVAYNMYNLSYKLTFFTQKTVLQFNFRIIARTQRLFVYISPVVGLWLCVVDFSTYIFHVYSIELMFGVDYTLQIYRNQNKVD